MALPQPRSGSDWTVETLRQHIVEIIAGQSRLLAEMDLRYQQRFDAQSKALDAALLAAQVAVNTALQSAKEAVAKAEVAAERRFESVNEFRGQLTDQAATFMPRVEAEQRIATNGDRISAVDTRLNELVGRVDIREGRTGGHIESTRNLVMVVGLALTAVTVLVGVYVAFHH